MKATLTILIIIILNCTFAAVSSYGQVVAIGHATAEVVESVSVSSNAITSFDINTTKTELSSGNLNLGELKVNSGTAIACNVVLKPATLSSSNGNSFTIEPSSNGSLIAGSQLTSGNQTLALTASASPVRGQASGSYQGSYSIILAYN